MPTDPEILDASLSEIRARGKANREKYEAGIRILYTSEPRLAEIDNELKSIGSKLVMAAFGGDTEAISEFRRKSEALTAEKKAILSAHGAATEPEHICPFCHDSGYVDGKICTCVRENAKSIAYARLFGGIGCGVMTFDNFSLDYYPTESSPDGKSPRERAERTLELCRSFARSFPKGENICLCGACGLGKTHLALAAGGEVALKGYTVIYDTAQSLLSRLVRENMSWDKESEYTDNVFECDLLIMDDLGTEFGSPSTYAVLGNLIDSRIRSGKSTVITTNMLVPELEKKYDPHLISRIRGNFNMCLLAGDDIRRLKKSKQVNGTI